MSPPMASLTRSLKDGAFLINAASHGRGVSRHDDFGNVEHLFKQRVIPRKPCDFTEHLIFKMLYLCIKFSHKILLPRRLKNDC